MGNVSQSLCPLAWRLDCLGELTRLLQLASIQIAEDKAFLDVGPTNLVGHRLCELTRHFKVSGLNLTERQLDPGIEALHGVLNGVYQRVSRVRPAGFEVAQGNASDNTCPLRVLVDCPGDVSGC